ncbi:hypothetical protein CspeluHIS016_0407760 [Cutaneotrichosporon spelunceum]|uniref:Uncharacterized protein n=1 Tax=Cutaneotrichosporon spelunceum TaxID=1672016 RepID=A0AAD3TWX6_9TREE|nr:hypothetical protein CspeluHIS016_0407760 [Cutaneotrichosporon spelunceum]
MVVRNKALSAKLYTEPDADVHAHVPATEPLRPAPPAVLLVCILAAGTLLGLSAASYATLIYRGEYPALAVLTALLVAAYSVPDDVL